MERLIMQQLLRWKNSENRKPLILDGARQVGKTWVLREFGKRHFSACAYLNCDDNARLRDAFSGGFSKERIVRDLSLVSGTRLGPETLLVLDEIQEIPEALSSLKYFREELPELPVAAAGSLLGLSVHAGTGFPVGKVDVLKMHPMTFSEFVRALKGEDGRNALMQSPMDSLATLHSEFKELLWQYYFAGGMPEAVKAFADGKHPDEVRSVQNAILYAYGKDFSKHLAPREVPRVQQVWQSIPQQLARENRKFVYGAVRSGARAKDFELAIQWLVDAGIALKVNRVRKAVPPLKFYEDFGAFKLYALDCGLLAAMSEASPEEMLVGDSVFEEFKGAFTEQFVLQQLLPGLKSSPFYFNADDSKQELDFLLWKDGRMVPVEVKAEENLRAKSLRQFVSEHPGTRGVRLSMSPYREQDWLVNVPLYATERLVLDRIP